MKDFVYDLVNNALNPKMLRLLTPVGFAFPSYIGEEWLNNLDTLFLEKEVNPLRTEINKKGKQDQKGVFEKIAANIVEHLSSIQIDHANLLIASITIDSYSRLLEGLSWTQKIKEHINGFASYKNDPVELQLSLLESYFELGYPKVEDSQNTTFGGQKSLSMKANSVAFWYIARAAQSNHDLVDAILQKSTELSQYFEALGEAQQEGAPEQWNETFDISNIFFQYLIFRRKNDQSPLANQGGFKIEDARRSIYYFERTTLGGSSNPPQDTNSSDKGSRDRTRHNIVVLGESGSGKTTFIKQILHASESSSDLEPKISLSPYKEPEKPGADNSYWSTTNNLPPGTIEETVVLQGNYRSFDQDVNFYLHDHNGELLSINNPTDVNVNKEEMNVLERLCIESDQLILTIPPSLIEDDHRLDVVLNRLFQYVKLAVRTNPDVIVSIVYTKCDDYGQIISGPRRVIHDPESAKAFYTFKYANELEKKENWANFVAISSGTSSHKQQAAEKGPTLQTELDRGWKHMKHHLLQKTKELWEKIGHSTGLKHNNLNGYFISAMHPGQERNRKSFNNRGVLEIVSDFLQFMNPPKYFHISTAVHDFPQIANHSERKVTIQWKPNGPHIKEYRIYKTEGDTQKLLLRSLNQNTSPQLNGANFHEFRLSPIKTFRVHYIPEVNLPLFNEYSFVDKDIRLDSEHHYQVVAVDKYNHYAFSNIQPTLFRRREGNFLDFFMSLSKVGRGLFIAMIILVISIIIIAIARS